MGLYNILDLDVLDFCCWTCILDVLLLFVLLWWKTYNFLTYLY